MDAKVYKAWLSNSYSAANVVTNTTTNPTTYDIFGLFPIKKMDLVSINAEVAVAETRGVWTIGRVTQPTIVANTRYQIGFGNTGVKNSNGYSTQLPTFGTTSVSVLTSAAVDRHNVYVALARQINANPVVSATAYPVITLAYDGQTANFTVGETVTGGTSGASGIVIADSDSGATGTLTIGLTTFGVDFQDNELITGSSTGSADVNGTATFGVYFYVIDDAGYYQPNTFRVGPNEMVANEGFASSIILNDTPGVVSRGQGAFLLADKPVQELLSANLRSGTWEMATNEDAVAGRSYTKYTIVDRPSAADGGLSGGNNTQERIQVLYLWDGEADYAATNTALDNLNP